MSGDRGPIDSLVADRRGVTINNTAAVATLLAFTVLIGGGLGAAVLFAEEEDTGPPGGNFTYEYFEDSSALLVTFDEGDEFEAGEILLTNGNANATWATVAGSNNTTVLEPGDTIQLSRGGAFGDAITSTDRVKIYWTGGNETTKLDEWNSSDSSGL